MSRFELTPTMTKATHYVCGRWYGVVASIGAQFNLLPQEALV